MASSDKNSDSPADVIEGEVIGSAKEASATKAQAGGSKIRFVGASIVVLLIAAVAVYLWLSPTSPFESLMGAGGGDGEISRPANTGIAPASKAEMEALRAEATVAADERRAMATRIEDLTTRVADLEAEAAASSQRVAEGGDGEAAPTTQMTDLTARVEALEIARATAVESEPAATDVRAEPAADISLAFADQLAALEGRLAALELENQRQLSVAAATARLAVAVYAGRPFEPELVALRSAARALAPIDQAAIGPRLNTIAPYAPVGVPSAGSLLDELTGLSAAALRAEATASEDGFWGRFWARLGNLITIRRRSAQPEDGDLDGRLFAIEDQLRRGDIIGADRLAAEFDGVAATVLSDWRERLHGAAVVRIETQALLALSESAGEMNAAGGPAE